MTVVDIHVHIYPPKIAAKATDAVGAFYGIPMYGNGSSEMLLQRSQGIDYQIVHSVATTPRQVISINDFIAEECKLHPSFIGFATMQQDFQDVESELDRALELGLCGVKIHPDIQQVDADDPRMMALYAAAEKRNMPLIIHAGDYRYDYSHPRRIAHILHEFPKLRVNAAHLGGWSLPHGGLDWLKNENCFVDMSSSMYGDMNKTREIIEAFGADRVMFGSDFPMWDPESELHKLQAMGFSKADYEKMCCHTAEAFLERQFSC